MWRAAIAADCCAEFLAFRHPKRGSRNLCCPSQLRPTGRASNMAHRFRDGKFPLRHGLLTCKPACLSKQKIGEAMRRILSFVLNSAQADEIGTRFRVRLTIGGTVGVFRKGTSACVKFLKIKNASAPAATARSLHVPRLPGPVATALRKGWRVPRNPDSTGRRRPLVHRLLSEHSMPFRQESTSSRDRRQRVSYPWPERTNVRPSEVKNLQSRDGMATDFCGKHLRAR